MNLKTILTLVSMCVASSATVAQTYTGTLSCSQSLSDAKRPSFEQPAELVVKNGNAQMKRSSDRYDELSEGQVVGQQLNLQGQGKRATGGESWTTKFQGTLDGRTFNATGGIYTTKGEKYRDCQVLLVNTTKPIERAAPTPTPAPIIQKPTEQVAKAPIQTPAVEKRVADSLIAASFDCQKAVSKTERMICSNPQTAKLDVVLSNAYRKTLAASNNANDVKNEQMNWLSSVRNGCETNECLDRAYATRIKALEQNIEPPIARAEISTPSRREIPTSDESEKSSQMQSSKVEQAGVPPLEEKVTEQKAIAPLQPELSGRELAKEKFRQELEAKSASYAAQQKIDQANNQSADRLLYGGGGLLAVLAGWFWNKFIRNRCPKCKSTAFDTTDVTETDRWRGTKTVYKTVPNPNGIKGQSYMSKGTNVGVTYVKKAYSYRCRACQNEWVVQKKEEL